MGKTVRALAHVGKVGAFKHVVWMEGHIQFRNQTIIGWLMKPAAGEQKVGVKIISETLGK